MLHEFRVDAASQKEGSAGMTEVVPADRGEARMQEERLEVAVDYVLSVLRGALACGENEPRVLVRRQPELRDETTREIVREALRLPERERGIVRQFGKTR